MNEKRVVLFSLILHLLTGRANQLRDELFVRQKCQSAALYLVVVCVYVCTNALAFKLYLTKETVSKIASNFLAYLGTKMMRK